jgi:hypothetical protein
MHFRTVVILLLISVLVCTGVFLFAKHRIAKAHEEGYQQALDDAGIDPVTMELDENATVEAGSLLEAVQSAKDLIAYKYHYESVGDYQKEKTFFGTDLKVPFTQDRSIFAYRGTISAGIDLKDLSASVDNSKKEITVFLPQPAVLAHEFEIDSFRIYDLKDSIFTKTSLADYAGMEKALKDLQESRLQDDEEFWSDVRRNTELVLKDLFSMTGQIEGYSMKFIWAK